MSGLLSLEKIDELEKKNRIMFKILCDIIKKSLVDGIISAGGKVVTDLIQDLKKEDI